MEDRELSEHLRLIDLMRIFDQTLQRISAAELADRPPLMARLRSIKQQMTQLEVTRR
jgi:hypothetical protein